MVRRDGERRINQLVQRFPLSVPFVVIICPSRWIRILISTFVYVANFRIAFSPLLATLLHPEKRDAAQPRAEKRR
jgi:hypothetical protein